MASIWFFKEIDQLFSRAAIQFYFPISNIWEILFLHILTRVWYHYYFFYFSCSKECVVISYHDPNCISLTTSDTVHYFMCISLVKCHSMYFAYFFFFFLVLSFEISLYSLDMSSSSDMWLANIFLQSVACLFILLTRSYTV